MSGRIVIAGGGFAGVLLAQRLERLLPREVELYLVSSENHMVFTPMLAEAAARAVSPLHIVVPGRQMVRRVAWVTAQATEVDRGRNQLQYVSSGGERGALSYDHLVLAAGSVVNFGDIPGLAAYAYPLKTLGDAIFLGNDLIGRLEEASVESGAAERARLLTVVVIGGGFSGVEIAGQITELMERARRFYPELNQERPRVVLVHRDGGILPELNAPSLSEFALRRLRAYGVEVRLQSEAAEVSSTEVRLASGEKIAAGTVVCTIGNTPSPLVRSLGLPLERGRLRTGPDMLVPGTSNVWALGDCAAVPNAWDGRDSPPTAQFATRQARWLARNLVRTIQGRPTEPFRYRPMGMLAGIGHHNAVAEILGVHISGFLAWFLWRGIYLSKLPTLGRKIEVAIDWAWQIFFPPNIVQLQMSRSQRIGRAHFAAGEFVYRRGDPGDRFFVIERGQAAVYLDEKAAPASRLNAGDHFGEGALLSTDGRGLHAFSVKAETSLDLITIGRDDFAGLSRFLLEHTLSNA